MNIRRLPKSIHLLSGNYGGMIGPSRHASESTNVSGEHREPSDSRKNPVTMGLIEDVVEVTCIGESGYGIFERSFGT